ncbi:MAG: hypothetical protein WCK00_17675 [Deltaproteobacteria bacterium]
MTEQPDYWKKLSPRQRLNDAVHKFAQANSMPYNIAWILLEQRYNERYRVNLSILRYEHGLRHGTKPTIPSHLEFTGQIQEAIDIALTMKLEDQENG